MGITEILSGVALVIALASYRLSRKGQQHSLMLGSPSRQPLYDDESSEPILTFSVINDGPKANRVIGFGLINEEGRYAYFDPEKFLKDKPLAPGDRIKIPISHQEFKIRRLQSGSDFVGIYVKDIANRMYAEPIREWSINPMLQNRRQLYWYRAIPYVYFFRDRFARKAKQFVFVRGLPHADDSI